MSRHRAGSWTVESLRSRLGRFWADPRGVVLCRLDSLWLGLFARASAILCRAESWCWGVEVGSSCSFYGLTRFRRHPGSVICIGSQCVFRSMFRSNLVGINRPCAISTHRKDARIVIGHGCGFSGTVVAAAEAITIGRRVKCGANVTITDFDWHAVDPRERQIGGAVSSAPIIVDDDVWLGLNCIVLKGVHIGENTVVGANSVVVNSLPANVIAAGNPAKVLRPLTSNASEDAYEHS